VVNDIIAKSVYKLNIALD